MPPNARTYCTHALHLSESAAYGRIAAARLARRLPCVLGLIEKGELTLTTVGLLAPHFTDENQESLLEAARNLSSIPGSATPPSPLGRTVPPRPCIVAPLAPKRYLLRVTIDVDTQRKLEHARALLRHQVPDGDPAAIIDRALTLLVTEAERTKFAATKSGRQNRQAAPISPRSRRIPNAIRRAVWSRDEGRCAFVSRTGRCGETAFLEFHHVEPFATGGASTVENLALRCRAHNQYEADRAGLPLWRTNQGATTDTLPVAPGLRRLQAHDRIDA